MKQTIYDSVIAVWSPGYLNEPSKRCAEDQNVKILQVEATSNPDHYLVELLRLYA